MLRSRSQNLQYVKSNLCYSSSQKLPLWVWGLLIHCRSFPRTKHFQIFWLGLMSPLLHCIVFEVMGNSVIILQSRWLSRISFVFLPLLSNWPSDSPRHSLLSFYFNNFDNMKSCWMLRKISRNQYVYSYSTTTFICRLLIAVTEL